MQEELVSIVVERKQALQVVRDGRFTRSQDVEKLLHDVLVAQRFCHGVTNSKISNLFEEGSDFEIDFYHPELAMAIEIEKGKHFNIWRNVCKFAESQVIEHAVLLIPYEKQNSKGQIENIFLGSLDSLSNIKRLYQKLKSFLLIGY